MDSKTKISELTSAPGYKGEEVHVGDWVETELFKGFYRVVGFSPYYDTVDRPSLNIKRGTFVSIQAKLEWVFTSTMKLKLGMEQMAVDYVYKVSDEKRKEIEEFWREHPKEYEKYEKFVVGKELGYEWWEYVWKPEELEYWKEEILKNPKKITHDQFLAWLYKTNKSCNEFFEGKKLKGKKSHYYVTIDLIDENIEVGKTPMFHNPRILFGR
ncbi:MAG: hypothetical protein V8S08_09470 [Lachnoclostridium sp.]